MSHSDWIGLIGFVALICSPIAYIWWRFGDPDRDDRISSRPASVSALLAIMCALNDVRTAADRDWIWFALFLGLTVIAVVRWRRERKDAVPARA